MSVTGLYCEGNAKSIDIRVIRQLLPKCDIRPLGGKRQAFFSSIIADRRRNPNLACLVDHDFDCRDWQKFDQPVQCWHEQVWVGWSWERKEIENYLIDPVVVKKALKEAPSRNEYKKALDEAAERIAAYSAARTALACERFKNFWGEEVRKGHFFPKQTGQNACLTKIGEIVRDYKGDRLISEEDVQTKFQTLLPQFSPDGLRFNDYLYCFAGKDLLYAMRPKLKEWGFEPPASSMLSPEEIFVERIVSRIERLENIWEWLPEWKTLRQLIEETEF